MSEENRFCIDKRAGCVAVVDRKEFLNSPGLHSYTPGVVAFWTGERKKEKCPECGHVRLSYWTVPEETLNIAHEICEDLNREYRNGRDLL